MTELAVIVPTRSRPQNIEPIVSAWWKTGAFGVADLWFAYDGDDMRVDEYEQILSHLAEVKAIRSPEWHPLVPKLNKAAFSLAQYHEYPYVAFMGDDHLPRTAAWAQMLVQDHHAQPNWIWYGRDGAQDQKLPTWWSMDSKIVKALGRMVPAPVQHLYCDNAVKKLGEEAGCLGYDERILIEHMHPLFGKGEMDAQYERVNRKQQYERDGVAFSRWVATGLAADATLVQNVGG